MRTYWLVLLVTAGCVEETPADTAPICEEHLLAIAMEQPTSVGFSAGETLEWVNTSMLEVRWDVVGLDPVLVAPDLTATLAFVATRDSPDGQPVLPLAPWCPATYVRIPVTGTSDQPGFVLPNMWGDIAALALTTEGTYMVLEGAVTLSDAYAAIARSAIEDELGNGWVLLEYHAYLRGWMEAGEVSVSAYTEGPDGTLRSSATPLQGSWSID